MDVLGILEIRHAAKVSEYPLTQPITTIGRSSDNQIVLNDDLVSRHHVKLEWVEGITYVTDLGSGNGTLVNGTETEPRVPLPLKEGAIISIGNFTLTLRLSPPSGKAPTPIAKDKTVIFTGETPAFMPNVAPNLIITTPQGEREFSLTQDTLTIGRDAANDITIDNQAVSRHHAKLQRTPQGYEITDLGSTNGLTFESTLTPRKLLANGDILWISESVSLSYKAPVEAQVTEPSAAPEKLDVKGRHTLTIGRSQDNDVALDHPAVSRRHAYIFRQDPAGTYMIKDLDSSNGTFVNNEHVVQPRQLTPGDIIRIGPIKLVYTPETLEKFDESSSLRIDALHLNQYVGGNVNLLQDISLTIKPHEFVAIVGGSGTGKSTLLKALNGFIPASNGSVLLNGDTLYDNFDAHRSQLGYVPQEDIIHRELTVYEALDYSAQLRLPADTPSSDRRQRVNEVLETIDLTQRKDLPISKLSGGQLKRVSIGVELLTKPGLFCLDEATSGLDPGIESQMMHLFRKLSDQGQTILLITHATKNVMLCDHVIFLARGGYLAYFGPPDEALTYFGVDDFDGIYSKLEADTTPEAWAQRYRQSAHYQKYIESRSPQKTITPSESPYKAALPGSQSKHISSMHQFYILSRRNLSILLRDRVSLILMVALAPILGALNFLFWKRNLFDPVDGDANVIIINFFMVLMFACMVGALSVMRWIVKEADIYNRERMVTLKIAPYVLSKLWMAIMLAAYQAVVFLLFLTLAAGWPEVAQMTPVFLTLMLTILASMLAGLFISAISPNPNVTPLLIILVIVPQLLFAGLLPMGGFGAGGKLIGQTMSNKWALESLITISGIGKSIVDDPCWQMPEEERDKLTEADKEELCTSMGVNIFSQCDLPGVRSSYNPSVDEPEPLEPAKPNDPPDEPEEPPSNPDNPPAHPGAPPPKPPGSLLLMNPIAYWQQMEAWNMGMAMWQQEMEQYEKDMKTWEATMTEYGDAMKEWEEEMKIFQEEMEAYEDAMSKYQDEMEVWQDEFQEWKGDRAKAIGGAEAKISRLYEEYGDMFNVNLASQWGWMMIIMALNTGLILGAMKWKDRKK